MTYRAGGGLAGERTMLWWPWKVQLGLEASRGRLESCYYAVDDTGKRQAMLSEARTTRLGLAAHGLTEISLLEDVDLVVSLRQDWVKGDNETFGGDRRVVETEMSMLSPFVALIWEPWTLSSLYASVGRSFKAPTLEQLFDNRPFMVPDPSKPGEFVSITLSNPDLDPQRGWNFEMGIRSEHGPVALGAVGYYMPVEDEIGFDLAEFTYSNIEESLHWGIEVAGEWQVLKYGELDLGYGLTKALFRGADCDGNQINGVPVHSLTADISYAPPNGPFAATRITRVMDRYLDEGNAYPLDDYTRVDLRLGYALDPLSIGLSVENLLDAGYQSTGYLSSDQMGMPVPLYYPGGERSVELELVLGI
jgi:outer membrane receptor protein involved in Fe transport